MASTTPRKQPTSTPGGRTTPSASRRPTSPTQSTQRSARPPSFASSPASSAQRSSRLNGTPISARAAVKKPTASTSSAAGAHLDSAESDSRAETSMLMDDLRERLQKAERVAEETRRHNEALQARLDDSNKEQAKQEERIHEDDERIEELENEKRELLKKTRELESIFEAERAAVMKDREATISREEELQTVIQRLKESLSQRDPKGGAEEGGLSRNASYTASSSPTLDANHFAPPSLQRSNSTRNNSKLLLQKDKLIEELRLELAELQIKLMEMENKGGGHMQRLEKALMEARVTNARLMEENESFQSLLMEKTLNGDFSQKGVHAAQLSETARASSSDGQPLSASLADELASAEDSEQDQEAERVRRLEVDVERQKAENKALTLYINKIIERILKHQGGFETILSNADDEASPAAAPPVNKDKELPPPPAKEGGQQEPQSILQRTKSLVYGRNKARPQSVIGPLAGSQSITENPSTAPSIPLQRSNPQRQSLITPRRAGASGEFNSGAAAVVGNMYRGLDHENVSTVSPGINSPRSSYFNLINRTPSQPSSSRPPTSEPAAGDNRPGSSADSAAADDPDEARRAALDALNGGGDPADGGGGSGNRPPSEAPSPPRSLGSNRDDGRQQQAILQGNKVRPLRLVAEEQQKKSAANNRASWMPNVGQWFNAAGGAAGPAGGGGGGGG